MVFPQLATEITLLLAFRDISKCPDTESAGGGHFSRGNSSDKCMLRLNSSLSLLTFWLRIILTFPLIGHCICFSYLGMLADLSGRLFEWHVS